MLNIKNRLEKKLKDTENKPEDEKKQLVWFLTIVVMVGVFFVWLRTTYVNLAQVGKSGIVLSDMPKFPEMQSIDIAKTLEDGKKILAEAERKNDTQWGELGDKYIKDNGLVPDDGFSNLELSDTKQEPNSVVLTYSHFYKSVLVIDSRLELAIDASSQAVVTKQDALKREINLAVDPTLSAKAASGIATKKVNDNVYSFKESKLAIAQTEGKFYLVWRAVFVSQQGGGREVLVGAKNGSVISPELATANQTSNLTQ